MAYVNMIVYELMFILSILCRECPAEMKEAVSSLMYAAARIAELPELCTLRQTFSEKYDSSLELLVNQDVGIRSNSI